MKGIILAGGTGARLFPLTKVTNKHLLPIYNEPMIFKVLKTLINSGIREFVITVGGNHESDIIKLVGDGKDFGVKISYVHQEGAGGIAEALYLTREHVQGDNIAVMLGDNIFEKTFEAEIKEFLNDKDHDCYLFLKEVPNPTQFGVAELDKKQKIISIEEKPEKPKSNMAVTGLYFYKKDIFERIEKVKSEIGYSKRGELEITDVNNLYVRDKKAKAAIVDGAWYDAGEFDSLIDAGLFMRDHINQSEQSKQAK